MDFSENIRSSPDAGAMGFFYTDPEKIGIVESRDKKGG
jgi:hypothetical protein